MKKSNGLIVIERRADFNNVYIGGQSNYKNWRDFIIAVEVDGDEKDAWEAFRNIGSFGKFSGRKMSASFYTRNDFEAFIEKDKIPKPTISYEKAATMRIVDAITKSKPGRLSDEEVSIRSAAFDFILSAVHNKDLISTFATKEAERVGLL